MSERSSSEQDRDEFTQLERQLTQLIPNKSQVDRETLLFRAGQESVLASRQPASRNSWLWPLTTAAMAIVSAGLSWQLYVRGEPTVIERVRIVEQSETEVEAETPSDVKHMEEPRPANVERTYVNSSSKIPHDNYLLRRELALTFGMDALTVPVAFRSPHTADTSSYRELRSTYTESPTMAPISDAPISSGSEQEDAADPTNNDRSLGDKS